MRVENVSRLAFIFPVFSPVPGKTMAIWHFVSKAKCFEDILSYTIAIITVPAPGLNIWPWLGPRPDAKCPKAVEVGCSG